MAMLEVRHLKKIYTARFGGSRVEALRNVCFSVEKGEQNGRTYTRVERLDRPGRIQALARLTGGEQITPAILAGAEELLRGGEFYRERQ